MKVLFDHQLFYNRYGGASKYFVMLLNSIPREYWKTTALFPLNEYAKEKSLMPRYPIMFRGQIRISEWLNKRYTNWYLKNKSFDVFHQTNFGTYCLKDLRNKPMVTTFHDINLSTFLPQPSMVEKQKISLQRADAIICVSDNTRRDMLNIFDIDESKVHVIHHGIEIPDLSNLSLKKIIDSPYILYVGVRLEYKNFQRLVRAFSIIHVWFPDLKLVCTSFPFNSEEIELLRHLSILDNVVHISATENQMFQLYRDALFFIYPSIYEGFGMPILEAWACKCPVLLSNASCFPEIAKDGGLYFDPLSVDDIINTMRRSIEDSDLRKKLVDRGNELVKTYSWEKCAQQHIKVYQSLL